MQELERRVAVAQACIDTFSGRPFAWGTADCIKLAALCVRKHGKQAGIAKLGRYSTAAGAMRALKRSGFKTLIEAIDARGFERIAPAAALPGDLVMLAGEDGPWGGALTVDVGGGRVFGFMDGVGTVLQPHAYVTAWRVA